jgi:hypothetical protein
MSRGPSIRDGTPTIFRIWVLSFLAVILTAFAEGIRAQEPPVISLSPPDAVSEETFTRISSIRELSDGSVLVADQAENRVALIVWGSQERREIGRIGGGPGEYRHVAGVFPLASDSTLFLDSFTSRWNFLDGAEIVDTQSEVHFLNRFFGNDISGTDAHGHILGVRGFRWKNGVPRRRWSADSLLLLLADRKTHRVDTLARIRGSGGLGLTVLPRRGNKAPMVVGRNPLAAEDQAVSLPDGSVALVRVHPFRVDWRDPDGQWREGKRLPFPRQELTKAEQCFAMERTYLATTPCDPSVLPGWPENIPPFLTSLLPPPSIMAAPGGHVLIRRTPTQSLGKNRYDVVDRRGDLAAVIFLDENQAFIGRGESSVYVVETDEVGLQTLLRIPWTF